MRQHREHGRSGPVPRPSALMHKQYLLTRIEANLEDIAALRKENERLRSRIASVGDSEQKQIRKMMYRAQGLLR